MIGNKLKEAALILNAGIHSVAEYHKNISDICGAPDASDEQRAAIVSRLESESVLLSGYRADVLVEAADLIESAEPAPEPDPE